MGLFSIDFEKYYQEQIEQGNLLMGIFCIQYPVYCIHANILDTTPDPLDNLDKIISDFLITKPNFTNFQIASLIGTSTKLVEMRIEKMLDDDLIKKDGTEIQITAYGREVFQDKTKIRQHKRSYDFYLDGITLHPLPSIYYSYYRYKYISEYDSYLRTLSNGKEYFVRPFGPDLVHTPPNKDEVIEKILSIAQQERSLFHIPAGLDLINDLSYTKLSIQLLVSVTKNNERVSKELLDAFALYSISDNISYTETLKRNVRIFEPILRERISNLEFRLTMPRKKNEDDRALIPFLTSNWQEIDKYKDSQNKCFSFAKDDLILAVKNIYDMKHLEPDSLLNTDTLLEININKKMLLESSNKHKLINDLLRKRDYKFGNIDNNVYLLYIYYHTSDQYVIEVMKFKELVNMVKQNVEIKERWLIAHQNEFSIDYRELFVSSGELDLLESIDIEKYMIPLN